MLMPKRVKYRKTHSAPRIKGNTKGGAVLVFGEYGLKALEPRWITARQAYTQRLDTFKILLGLPVDAAVELTVLQRGNTLQRIAPATCVRIEITQRLVLGDQMAEHLRQHQVLEYIGEIAGVIDVAVAEQRLGFRRTVRGPTA